MESLHTRRTGHDSTSHPSLDERTCSVRDGGDAMTIRLYAVRLSGAGGHISLLGGL
ncbi:hypothetical protein BZB76_0650 [Actinomadura pelletieri DSM 43383]|uniref:Uncharacterized protein n=1 Tax=Actinomadura pelletieri DSM 43383 TaxID=1120940 RepID=A0A495QYI6_9ACTN|nr:hypothetical protein BZB76_0650 [Actinomadura pelletieri DSM 43383]